MDIVICPNADVVGRVAAARVARVLVDAGPKAVLGVATGSSPLALYDRLAGYVADGRLDLTAATAFALDEYVGLDAGHPESYAAVIDRTVTVPLRMDPARVHVPDGFAADLPAAAAAYDQAIRAAGGIDVQILGVGANGHIGFNEPGTSFASRTHVTALTAKTRSDNARFFDSVDEVPFAAMTQGLDTIMDARATVLVAQGAGKADAIAAIAEGPVTAFVPGSILQFHPRATLVVDEDAAAGLKLAGYYREAYASRPAWQVALDEF